MELLAAGLASRYGERHTRDYECITVREDQVVIERRERGSVCRFEFNGRWAQLIIGGPRRIERGRLAFRSHGKEVEFGMFLTNERLTPRRSASGNF